MEEIEEWNEFGELKDNIGDVPANNATPSSGPQGVNIRPTEPAKPKAMPGNVAQQGVNKAPAPILDKSKFRPLPGAAEIAVKKKPQPASNPVDETPKAETMTSAPAEKEEIINAAKEISKHHPALDHLSAPASRIHSGTVTPQPEPEPAAAAGPSDGVGGEAGEKQHRGSEIKEVPQDEVKKVESETTLHEEDEEEGDPAKGLEDLKVGDEAKTQEQDAKEGENAGKSVQD